MHMRIDQVLAAAFQSGDFEPLLGLYGPDALLDWSMPGRRARVVGPEAIGKQLRAWWPRSGVFTRWDVSTFSSGLTIEFEGRAGGVLQRQRQFLQVREGRIVRHQAYCARPHGGKLAKLPDDAPVAAARRRSRIVGREPLTHAGQSGTSLERIELVDGRRLVVKRLSGDDWVARVTHDGGREASLWTDGVLARMPPEIDHAVLAAGREGTGTWLLMRDVSDELLSPDRRLTRDESRRLLSTFAAMHRRFAGERMDGACSLEDRITIAAPATVAIDVNSSASRCARTAFSCGAIQLVIAIPSSASAPTALIERAASCRTVFSSQSLVRGKTRRASSKNHRAIVRSRCPSPRLKLSATALAASAMA